MSVIYQTTPQVQDQYSRNYMQVFDELEIIDVSTLFQGFFSKPGSKTLYSPDANAVEINVMRGNRKTAALVPRGTISQKLGPSQKDTLSQQYTAFARSFPLIEEEGSINANQILNKTANEGAYERQTRQMRMRILAMREHDEQIRRTIRLCERLASYSILNGTMPAILGTSDDELTYNWRRNTDHFVTLAESWFAADHDIVGDCMDAFILGRNNGKMSLDTMLLGERSMSAFIQSAQVQTLADNRRFQLIEAGSLPVPSEYGWMISKGAIPRGRLQLPEGPTFWLFTYLDGYDDDDGVFVNYMPVEKVLFFANRAQTHRYFGPPERMPVDTAEMAWYRETFGFNMERPPMPPNIKDVNSVAPSSMFYFDAYRTEDKKKIVPRLQSAPIYAPIQTDAYVVIENAGAAVE